MKAFAVKQYKPMGDMSGLEEIQVDKPTASGKDLLVKIKAVATNPVDFKVLGNFGNHTAPIRGDHLIVGYDACGVVEAVGEEVQLFQVGDEVIFAGDMFRPGCFAEYSLVDERIVAKKPASLSYSQAASAPLTSLTAWEAFFDQFGLTEDKTANADKVMLITGGGGGVATVAVEIAKKVLGLTVIATASRPETTAKAKELGADHVINHYESMPQQIKELGIEEVDFVFHTVDLNADLFNDFCSILKPFGRICCTTSHADVNLVSLMTKSLTISAILMFTRPAMHNDGSKKQHEALTRVSELLDKGILTCRETANYPLTVENLRKALELQAGGKTIGKMTLTFE